MSPYYFIRQALLDILNLINSQRVEEINSIFTPFAKDLIDKSLLKIQQHPYTITVLSQSKKLYQVSHTTSNVYHATTYNVDMFKGTCSCLKWSQLGIPCVHCIQVGIYLKAINEDFYNKYVNKLWFTTTFSTIAYCLTYTMNQLNTLSQGSLLSDRGHFNRTGVTLIGQGSLLAPLSSVTLEIITF